MIKALSRHSNSLEILFWDCVFHTVKMLHLVRNLIHEAGLRLSGVSYLNLLILMVVINAGLIIGMILGLLRNL